MITGWGANGRYKMVHYFRDSDGRPACATLHKKNSMATISLNHWNPDHPNTCKKCRRIYQKIAVETTIGKTSTLEV